MELRSGALGSSLGALGPRWGLWVQDGGFGVKIGASGVKIGALVAPAQSFFFRKKDICMIVFLGKSSQSELIEPPLK